MALRKAKFIEEKQKFEARVGACRMGEVHQNMTNLATCLPVAMHTITATTKVLHM